MINRETDLLAWVLVASLGWSVPAQSAPFSFFDGTFNPADLTFQITSETNQSISSTQSATGGNPGAAFEFDAVFGTGFSTSQANVFENSFLYDPGINGQISSIAFSVDVFATGVTALTSNGETLILRQGNKVYFAPFVSVPPVLNSYNTASRGELTATNFTASDGTHPNFSAGIVDFGFVQGYTAASSGVAGTFVSRVDNFLVSVTAIPNVVPEPASAFLVALGLGLVAAFSMPTRFGRGSIAAGSLRVSHSPRSRPAASSTA